MQRGLPKGENRIGHQVANGKCRTSGLRAGAPAHLPAAPRQMDHALKDGNLETRRDEANLAPDRPPPHQSHVEQAAEV